MPSISYRQWRTVRAAELEEIAQAQAKGTRTRRRGRARAQQLNRAFAVLLAGHFQGFCRNLHTECVDHLINTLAPPLALLPLLQTEFTRGRQLDRGNAQPASIGSDFGRF